MWAFLLLSFSLVSTSEGSLDLQTRLRGHVAVLSSDSLEGRGVGSAGLSRAEEYIVDQLIDMGLTPPPRRPFDIHLHGAQVAEAANTVATIEESDGAVVILSAHVDHLGIMIDDSTGERLVFNGAHDNASGVAVALEATRLLTKREASSRGIRVAFFTAEEAGLLGSSHYVDGLADPRNEVFACLNLDAIGHLDSGAVLAIGLNGQPELDSLITSAFSPAGIDVQRSLRSYATGDQVPFLDRGIPAVMLTTGPHHLMNTIEDDAETLDYEGLARITEVVVCLIGLLVEYDGVLSIPPKPERDSSSADTRRVRFGIMPDFAYANGGVRVGGTTPSSPAEKAGVIPGDILITMAGDSLSGPKSLADALSKCDPGDTIEVVLRRDGAPMRIKAVLGQRDR